VDARHKAGHDDLANWLAFESGSGRGVSSDACRRFPQTIPAQAILARIDRHRQPGGFLRTPARPRQAAGEFRSAAGTGEAARGRNF